MVTDREPAQRAHDNRILSAARILQELGSQTVTGDQPGAPGVASYRRLSAGLAFCTCLMCGREQARKCVLWSHPHDEFDATKVLVGRLVYLLGDEQGVLAWRSNRRNVASRQARPVGPLAVRRGTASLWQQRSAFYNHGVNGTGIDAITAAAGVAKMSLLQQL